MGVVCFWAQLCTYSQSVSLVYITPNTCNTYDTICIRYCYRYAYATVILHLHHDRHELYIYIGGSGKQAHSLAGRFCKKYLGYEHSETGYRRIFFSHIWRIFSPNSIRAKKKKNRKKLFSPYKIIDSENFIKVSQNPNKVAGDTQGLPTVPHNDFGGLNFKGLASKYLLLMTLPPADDEKMKKNRTSGTPTSKKTSDSASSSKVCHCHKTGLIYNKKLDHAYVAYK